ncbi:aspartyl/asparaginyl beta-hydroxylase domain-containing protein [Streptomyces sp. NPDC101160]|uniref:aspartyl/asparaginyl beta-hydroxylase domain-containing protein n=1 Tax=Streptomyces sp. NPDC101160 TaxID=3366118 RepID=UPI0038272961
MTDRDGGINEGGEHRANHGGEHSRDHGAEHGGAPDPLPVLRGIRDANYHRPGIRCLRLFSADAPTLRRLVAEVERLRAVHAPSLAGTPGHVTAWAGPRGRVEQFSLLNASGRCDDFSRDHDLSCFGKRFHDRTRYPALSALAGALPHLVNFRVNVLGPGAALEPHEEHSVVRSRTGTVGVRARFHLPLVTGPEATLLLDGDMHHLEAGTVYLVNHGCVHAAANTGATDRVHLVWDMLVTAAAAEVMFGTGAVPDGFSRTPARAVRPTGRRTVTRWERIAPQVGEAEARHVGLLDPQ